MLRQVLYNAFTLPVQPFARDLYEVMRKIRKRGAAEGGVNAAPRQRLQPPQDPQGGLGAFHGLFGLLQRLGPSQGLRNAAVRLLTKRHGPAFGDGVAVAAFLRRAIWLLVLCSPFSSIANTAILLGPCQLLTQGLSMLFVLRRQIPKV